MGWRAWQAVFAQPRRFTRKPAFTRVPGVDHATRRKPDWVSQEVLRLKVLMGHAGCRQIAHTFNRLNAHHRTTVGKSFVAHCLHTHQHALAALRRDMRGQLPRPVPVNAVWAMDLTYYTDANGTQHAAIGILDHGSRLVTGLRTLVNKRSWTLLGHLCLAIGRH